MFSRSALFAAICTFAYCELWTLIVSMRIMHPRFSNTLGSEAFQICCMHQSRGQGNFILSSYNSTARFPPLHEQKTNLARTCPCSTSEPVYPNFTMRLPSPHLCKSLKAHVCTAHYKILASEAFRMRRPAPDCTVQQVLLSVTDTLQPPFFRKPRETVGSTHFLKPFSNCTNASSEYSKPGAPCGRQNTTPKKDLHSQCCKPTLWKQHRQLCSATKSSAAPGSRTGSDKLFCSRSGRVLHPPAKPKAARAYLQSRYELNWCTQLVTVGVNKQRSAAAALNGPGGCAPAVDRITVARHCRARGSGNGRRAASPL